MTRDPELLRRLADVLEYPGPGFLARVAACAEALAAEHHPAAAARLARFVTYALGSAATDLEEAYTRAFDLAPLASPYVGDQLFGPGRERAFLLSGLAELRRDAGLARGAELPDHVAEVLRLVAMPVPPDVADDLVRDGLVPALRKILAALEGARHPWADAVAAALDVLAVGADAPGLRPVEATP